MANIEYTSTDDVASAEKLTLQIELEKLTIEKQKIKWTAISVMIPLLAAIGTVAYGIWNTHELEKANFQLEAAKSVMQAPSLSDSLGRAKLLTKLFPDKLPKNFFPEIDLTGIAIKGDTTLGPKANFVNAVASKGLSPLETARLWHSLLKEEWSNDAEGMALIEKSPA